MNKRALELCSALLIAALYVTGCTSERFDTLECRQMRDLAHETRFISRSPAIKHDTKQAAIAGDPDQRRGDQKC